MAKSANDLNINGEVRDQDTFVLGDDDEEEENEEERPEIRGDIGRDDGAVSISPPPPLYELIVDPWKEESPPQATAILTSNSAFLVEEPKLIETNNIRPYKYYINRSDTLQGLSLRFGIDVSTIPWPLF
jgi:hypothetical protein